MAIMPRRQFVADLRKVQEDPLPRGIANVKAGEDDGQIEFEFDASSTPIKITAMVPDLADYPKSHEYMIFADDNAPRDLSAALNNVRGTDRKTVFELLDIVSATLMKKVAQDQDGDSQMDDLFDEDEQFDDEADSDGDIYDSDHEAFEIDPPAHNAAYAARAPTSAAQTTNRAWRQRVRADLREAKNAGFKVGYLGSLLDGINAYVTVSIRVAKLGISDEAMQAWQVERSDYLILIIQYPNGYKTNEELQGYDSLRLAPNLCMRVVAGKKYKPTLKEAIKAFTIARNDTRKDTNSTDLPGSEETQQSFVRDTFISKPLVNLLQERLVPLLRFRSAGMDWLGAEGWYRHHVAAGGASSESDHVPDRFFEPEVVHDSLPAIMHQDHYKSRNTTQYSFPLLAMQYMLRHFVRCTEFCLVCHRKLETEVEAIKPYVCDDNLCLYQYMSLGFGPSIEYELMAQPYVVDLLISFCYTSAAARRLKDFPDGLSLTVPPVDLAKYNYVDPYAARRPSKVQKADNDKEQEDHPKYKVGFDRSKLEIIFHDTQGGCPVRRGNWIVMTVDSDKDKDFHCRVADVSYFPTISIDEPVEGARAQTTHIPGTPAATRPGSPAATTPNWAPAEFQVYCQDFINLNDGSKCVAMMRLLDTLPTVLQMREYLLSHQQSAELKNWTQRISPSALTLLRWIIASNRSCIMQVDENTASKDKTPSDNKQSVFGKDQERCCGMKDYMQFRFAMGAPDKEQRFVNEVRKTTTRLKLDCPTIFAFHGSPLYNWHMIIREGLHYKSADHGRAYGDGVYHATDAATSCGYSGMSGYGYYGEPQGRWPASVLRIDSALALNEIVNAPIEFTSQAPYYVVQHLDWIQTRYLFVKTNAKDDTVVIGQEKQLTNPCPQDPKRTPRGISGPISIPASAIKSRTLTRRTEDPPKNPSPLKKMKLSLLPSNKGDGSASAPVVIDGEDDDNMSVATEDEDLAILTDEPPEVKTVVVLDDNNKKKPFDAGPKTDFTPGSLDFSKLPIMPLPTYATSATTKRLMKELQNLQKVQESTNLAELGWYIDVEKIENVYQWIVELHSFHTFEVKGKPLPLADDMKKQNLKNIVLEIRFNKDFPFSPPYVRVLRPRFLSLAAGGGGHIVMGGAMCMELLTNTGWSSVSSMESVLMQIRMAIASEPFARLEQNRGRVGIADYGVGEAAEGYMRACRTHGWEIPPGFQQMAYHGGGAV